MRTGGKKFFGIPQDEFIGGGVVVIAEPMLDSLIGKFAGGLNLNLGGIEADEVIKLLVAQKFASKSGVIGAGARTLRTVAAVRIVGSLLKGFNLGGLFGGAAATSVSNRVLSVPYARSDPLASQF